MGSTRRKPDQVAVIDTGVTVLGGVSYFWEWVCNVSHMVAPDLADQTNDSMYPVDYLAIPTLRVVDHDIAEGTSPVLHKLSTPPSDEVTAEIDGATDWLRAGPHQILSAPPRRGNAQKNG